MTNPLLGPGETVDGVRAAGDAAMAEAGIPWDRAAVLLRAILPPDMESASPFHGRGIHVTTSAEAPGACPFCDLVTPGLEYHVELPDGPPGNAVTHPYWASVAEVFLADGYDEGSLMEQFATTFRDRAARTTILADLVVHTVEAHQFLGGTVPAAITPAWLAQLQRLLPPPRARRGLPLAR